MPHSPRLEHARRVLEDHPDGANLGAHELSDSRYALVGCSDRCGRDFVSGHGTIDDALACAGESFLDVDCWSPVRIVDLDTGENVGDENSLRVHVTVTIERTQ